MPVKQAVFHRFSTKAALAVGLACTLTLSGCASWRNQTGQAAPVATDAASDAEQSAAIANAGAQTVQATRLQRFLWIFSPYRPDIQQGNFVSQEMLDQLKAGQTRDQVRFLLGSPLLMDAFHADRWDYPFYLARGNGELTTSRVTVFFKNDVVERFEGGNLPSEREYIDRIAGPSKGSQAHPERRPVEPAKVNAPATQQ